MGFFVYAGIISRFLRFCNRKKSKSCKSALCDQGGFRAPYTIKVPEIAPVFLICGAFAARRNFKARTVRLRRDQRGFRVPYKIKVPEIAPKGAISKRER